MWYLGSGQDLSKPTYQQQTGTSYSGAQQHGAQGGQSGAPECSYQFEDGSWSLSSDPSGEDEPVFTPVTDEDQVYAYKSRSRYNGKRDNNKHHSLSTRDGLDSINLECIHNLKMCEKSAGAL